MNMKYLRAMAAATLTAAALASLSGCASDGKVVAKHFTVDISSLDWVEVTYIPDPADPVFTMPCRLSLWGSGEIDFRTGRSPRVWNDFSDKLDDPNWNEYYTDRWHVGKDKMQELYQELVDKGAVPMYPSRAMLKSPRVPFIKMNAQIKRERVMRNIDDRDMVAVVERLLQHFEETAKSATAAMRKRPGPASSPAPVAQLARVEEESAE